MGRGGPVRGHHLFRDLPAFLRPGDLLVLNDTRVVPARLIGRREQTGGRWEGLFLQEHEGIWELLAQTRGRPQEGETLLVDPPHGEGDSLALELVGRTSEGRWLVRPRASGGVFDLLARHGQVPLPPYIRKGRASGDDLERYQTVYAHRPGAVAAPTAGLHFSPEVFAQIEAMGVERTFVTLHVGAGTFRPIQVDDIAEHRMHEEWCELSEPAAEAIRACKQRGGRIIAVGTTSVRVLESAALEARKAGSTIAPTSMWTDLFIRPPFEFRIVDGLITNFHLPRSSLLLLVAAFTGREVMMSAYRDAIAREYRFYSYGDAMLILPEETS